MSIACARTGHLLSHTSVKGLSLAMFVTPSSSYCCYSSFRSGTCRAIMSFITCQPDSHFPLQNLPYGVCSRRGAPERHICTAIGSYVVDLAALSNAGCFSVPVAAAFQQACVALQLSLHKLGGPWARLTAPPGSRVVHGLLLGVFAEAVTLKVHV